MKKEIKKIELFFAIATLFLLLGSFLIKANIAVNDPPPEPGGDPEGYHRYATRIAKGWSLSSSEPPGQYYYLALVYSLFSPNLIIGRFSIIILSLISSVLIYHIAKLLFNKTVAMIAFVISLYDPLLIHYSSHLHSEITYIFLILLAVFFSLKFLERKSYWYIILATIPIILATYIRVFTILLIPFLIILVAINIKDKKVIAKSASIILILTLLVIGGTTLRNYYKFHHLYFIAVSSSLMLYHGNHPDSWGTYSPSEATRSPFKGMDVYERSNKAFQLAMKTIKDHPRKFIKKNAVVFFKIWFKPYNEYKYFHTYYKKEGNEDIKRYYPVFRGYYLILQILCLLGIIFSIFLWKKNLLIFFYFITISAACMLTFLLERYKIPLLPFLIIYASYVPLFLKDRVLLARKHIRKINKEYFLKHWFERMEK